MTAVPSTLYVVATPIGNLDDMVPRAIEVLQTVDVVAAEDTRHSSRLFSQFDINTPLIPYHDHSDDRQVQKILDSLSEGSSVALISDAGTPLISDPGYRLVREVQQSGFSVVPIPGPCALIAALSVSGLPSDRFSFLGFLPAKSGQRQNKLQAAVKDEGTLIFYEAPHRIVDSLADMAEVFGGDREVVMAREITKTYETIKRAALDDMLEWVKSDHNQQKGEIVLLVHGYRTENGSEISEDAQRVTKILLEQLPVKQACQLAAEITGLKKNALYKWAIEQQD